MFRVYGLGISVRVSRYVSRCVYRRSQNVVDIITVCLGKYGDTQKPSRLYDLNDLQAHFSTL